MKTTVRLMCMFVAASSVVCLAACEPEPGEMPGSQQTAAPRPYSERQPVESKTLAMKVIRHLEAGRWELASRDFDEDADLPDAAGLEQFWTELENAHGAFVDIVESQGQHGDTSDTVRVTLEFEDGVVETDFEIRRDKVIALAGPGLK